MAEKSSAEIVPRARGKMEGCDRAPRNSFTVEQLAILCGGLNSVTQGVAEIEDHAEVGFVFVTGDNIGFDLDGAPDEQREGWMGLPALFLLCGVEDSERSSSSRIIAALNGFLDAGPNFRVRQGGKQVSVDEHR